MGSWQAMSCRASTNETSLRVSDVLNLWNNGRPTNWSSSFAIVFAKKSTEYGTLKGMSAYQAQFPTFLEESHLDTAAPLDVSPGLTMLDTVFYLGAFHELYSRPHTCRYEQTPVGNPKDRNLFASTCQASYEASAVVRCKVCTPFGSCSLASSSGG